MKSLEIELMSDEQALLERVELDQARVTPETFDENADTALALFRKLSERDAIPEHRLRWFTDAACNPGDHGTSRLERWHESGTRGDEIIRNHSFLAILRYFIKGPDLPARVIAEFCKAAENCGGRITSSDIPKLSDTARRIARANRLEPHEASGEFYKLALEQGISPHWCVSFRDKVRAIRYSR